MTKSKEALLLVGTLLTAGALFAPVTPAAAEYEMQSYLDSPGGKEIAAGDYDTAIVRATSAVARTDAAAALVAATNLCVAYTVTGAFEPAKRSCDRALTLARRADGPSRTLRNETGATAKALLNRGVLRAVSGDVARAAADFRAALRGAGSAADRNLAQLESLRADRLAASAE